MKADKNGDDLAQNNLWYFYINGIGVKKDYEKAVYWFKKAEDNFVADAQYNLGICYENGMGVKKDLEKSL